MPTRRTNNPGHIIVVRTDSPQRATPEVDRSDAINQALTERRQASEHHARNDAQIAAFAQAAPAVWQAYLDTLAPDERQVVEARARRGKHRS
ncbi:MAG: hypothetical protein MI924_25835 [Chloroflexales bacterium]|nr:hypothetical protein [Chloroflexales bacterium]